MGAHKTGTDKVAHSAQHYGHSSASEEGVGATTNVGYINIESLITGLDDKRIDLLKCDIEGSEEIFIAAYRDLLQKTDTAVFEFHAGECNIDNCRTMLQRAGLFSKGIIKQDAVYKTSVEIFSRR